MNLLYIVPLLPRYDRGSGENRLFEILRLLRLKGCGVTVLQAIPYTGMDADRYEALLRDIGVRYVTQVGEFLKEAKSKDYDCCVIAWYGLAAEYINLLRNKFPAAKIIVDSVDVHWLRYERGVIVGELVMPADELGHAKEQEKRAYAEADEVWAITQEDKSAILKELPGCEIRVVSISTARTPAMTITRGIITVLFLWEVLTILRMKALRCGVMRYVMSSARNHGLALCII